MRLVSHLLGATIALVFVFGLLGSLLTGSKAPGRLLARRSRLVGAHAWVSGFGGNMGWDGFSPEAAADPVRRIRRRPLRRRR
jgi:hypothetical protein